MMDDFGGGMLAFQQMEHVIAILACGFVSFAAGFVIGRVTK